MTVAVYEIAKANPYHRGKGAEGGRFTSKEEAGREGAPGQPKGNRLAPSASRTERQRRAELIRAMRGARDAETELKRRGLLDLPIPDRRKAYYESTTSEQRRALNDAANTVTARMAEIVGRRAWDRSMEGVGTADEQTAAFRASVAQRLAEFVDDGTVPEDTARIVRRKATVLDDAMAESNVQPEQRRPIVRLFTDALIAQEHEAIGRALGDHGVRHLMTDSEMAQRAYDLVQTAGGSGAGHAIASGPDRVAFLLAGAFHDIGYLTPAARNFLDDDHPGDSSVWFDAHVGPALAEAFNPAFVTTVGGMIRTHAETALDWERDVPASSFRLADNMALFHFEKLPGLVRYAPRTRGVLAKFAAGEIDATEAKRSMTEIVNGRTDLHPKLRARLNDAVAEVSPVMPKLTLGMWSGSMAGMRFDRKARKMEVEVDVVSSKANAALYRVSDLGYRQFAKMAQTFGLKSPDQWNGDETFEANGLRLRLLKGATRERGRLVTAVAAMNVPPHIAQALRESLGITAIRKSGEEERLVTGWASVIADADGVPIVDVQNDVIELRELEQASRAFMRAGGVGGVLHIADADDNPVEIGRVVESFVVTPELKKALDFPATMPLGWLITVHVEEDAVWDAVKRGELQAFSIGGTAERELIAKANFNPDQPRVDAGVPEGGRWVSATFVSTVALDADGKIDPKAVPSGEAAWREAYFKAHGNYGVAVRVHGTGKYLAMAAKAAEAVVRAMPAKMRAIISEQHARLHAPVPGEPPVPAGWATVHVFESIAQQPGGDVTDAVAYYQAGARVKAEHGDGLLVWTGADAPMNGSFGVIAENVATHGAMERVLRIGGVPADVEGWKDQLNEKDFERGLGLVLRHEAGHAIDAWLGPPPTIQTFDRLKTDLSEFGDFEREMAENFGVIANPAMMEQWRVVTAKMWSDQPRENWREALTGIEQAAKAASDRIQAAFPGMRESATRAEWVTDLSDASIARMSKPQASMITMALQAEFAGVPETFADIAAWLTGGQGVRSAYPNTIVPLWGKALTQVASEFKKKGIPILRPELRTGHRRPTIEAKLAPRRAAIIGKWLRAIRKFDPNQPRVPAGQPGGGQWAGGSVVSGGSDDGHDDRYYALGALIDQHGADWPAALLRRPFATGVIPGDIAQLATRMEDALRQHGGFTIDARTRQDATHGIAVGVFPDHSDHFPVEELSVQRVERWLRGQKPALLADRRIDVGGWLDKETNTVWLDLVRIYTQDQKPLAIRMGRRKNQISVADLDAIARGDWDHAIIPTGGTGAAPAEQAVSKQAGKRPVFLLFDGDVSAEQIVTAIRSHL